MNAGHHTVGVLRVGTLETFSRLPMRHNGRNGYALTMKDREYTPVLFNLTSVRHILHYSETIYTQSGLLSIGGPFVQRTYESWQATIALSLMCGYSPNYLSIRTGPKRP